MRLGFIGAGQMATALAKGIASGNGTCRFAVYDPNPSAVESFEKSSGCTGLTVCQSNIELVKTSDVIFVAVKPQVIESALAGLPDAFEPGKTYVSVVAGISIARLQELSGSSQIVRTMPNTPCLIGTGAIAIAPGESVSAETTQRIRELLSSVGIVVDVQEYQIDAVTGLSGSGPAFVYTFIEALIDGGVLAGLPRSIARPLALQTVFGATRMLMETDEHPSVLRDRVTSPGGTTIYGMAELEGGGFRDSIQGAILAATQRAADLGG